MQDILTLISQPVWKPIVGLEGVYEVSHTGLVRSLDRTAVYTRRDQYSGRDLVVRRRHKGRLLRPAPNDSRHLSVVLGRERGSQPVHILVMTAFVGPCPDGMECRHLDGCPDNNLLTNLRWGTRSQNVTDALDHGAMPRGSRKFNAKLRESDIPLIRELMLVASYSAIGRKFGVSEATIRQVRDGKTWRHV
jgi:HNH endonuclease/NUMOD4 motif